MPITVQLEDDGYVTILADERLFRFVCVHRDSAVRVCPRCYSRTETGYEYCRICGWVYVHPRAPY